MKSGGSLWRRGNYFDLRFGTRMKAQCSVGVPSTVIAVMLQYALRLSVPSLMSIVSSPGLPGPGTAVPVVSLSSLSSHTVR